jgi:ribulose-phosphate 3-epimerase
VLVMSVNPGYGGQRFIDYTLRKVARLRTWIEQRNLPTLIEIDGGVNLATIASVANAGVDVAVAGSAVFGAEDYAAAMTRLRFASEGK